jgi:hypothetical protein
MGMQNELRSLTQTSVTSRQFQPYACLHCYFIIGGNVHTCIDTTVASGMFYTADNCKWGHWKLEKGNDQTAVHKHLSSSMKHASLTTYTWRSQEIKTFYTQHLYLLCNSLYMIDADKSTSRKECCHIIKSIFLTTFQLQFFWQRHLQLWPHTSNLKYTQPSNGSQKIYQTSNSMNIQRGQVCLSQNQKLSIHMNHHFINS